MYVTGYKSHIIHVYIYIYIERERETERYTHTLCFDAIPCSVEPQQWHLAAPKVIFARCATPTKNLQAKIAGLKFSGEFPADLGIPPHKFKILLESNPLKLRILVRRLDARSEDGC